MSTRLCYHLLSLRRSFNISSVNFASRFNVKAGISFSSPPKNVVYQVQLAVLRCASTTNQENRGTEIYNGPLSKRIRSVKLFSFTTSFCGLMIQPMMVQKMYEEGTSIGLLIFGGAILQFFTFATPVLLNLFTKKYVRAIYYDSETDTYSALTYDFWAADKWLKFKTDEVVVPDIPGMLTSVVIKGTPLLFEANFFSDLEHYKRIMGYDKPIDFKLYNEEKSGTDSKS